MLRPGTILQQKNICFFIFPFCLTDFYSIVNPFGIFVYLFREELYSMKQRCDRPRPTVGARNIKTALSASLCALLYFLIDRNPTFACIGAIFGMGANMEHSKLHGGNRLFGTVIGGFLGMGLFRLYLLIYPDGGHRLLLVPLLFLGVIVLIVLAQCFWIGAVQPGGVVGAAPARPLLRAILRRARGQSMARLPTSGLWGAAVAAVAPLSPNGDHIGLLWNGKEAFERKVGIHYDP